MAAAAAAAAAGYESFQACSMFMGVGISLSLGPLNVSACVVHS